MRDIVYCLKKNSVRTDVIGEIHLNQLLADGWERITFARFFKEDTGLLLQDEDDHAAIARLEAEGFRRLAGTTRSVSAEPFEGYDELSSEQIIEMLPTLSDKIRNHAAHYEFGNRNRPEVVEALRID